MAPRQCPGGCPRCADALSLPSIDRAGERIAWLPRERMLRYQWAKVLGDVVVCAIFAGWLLIQWSNPLMRAGAVALLAITAWVVVASVLSDARRSRGRRLWLEAGQIRVVEPGVE